MNLYDITVRGRNGDLISLSQYKEKTLLIVNTATGCGFTPQYEGLETLYRKYKNQGFEILDFPCNQFGHQAPGTEEEIHEFCTMNYEVSFPQFAKIEVNGSGESPLYSYLKSQKSGFLGSKIKWNFTKFLVDKEGTVVNRYAPTDKPEQLEKDILALLEGFTNLAAKRS
ncbi:glutathione peroxidase [Lacrimispora amygdalina]|uniref:glutathione peroxidase n=1 Tax=Lacrimispora amygdalina TaxID=253257 RepID=UPI000BE47944|nr:glutathione peroxidase [Lacrimispora amygdalina]